MMMRQWLTQPRNTSYFTILFLFSLFLTPSVSEAQISGTVFRDYNANGFKDNSATFNEPFVAGVTVKAYNAAGVQVGGTQTTPASGAYSFTGLTLPLRVEFSGLNVTDFTAVSGSSNSSSVQFHTASSTTAHFGIQYPRDYCGSTNPTLMTSCYVSGDQVGGVSQNDPVLISFPYNAGSRTVQVYTSAAATDVLSTIYDTPTSHTLGVAAKLVGTTFGLAYARTTQRLYAGAFFKKHAGFGAGVDGTLNNADDPSAIYVMNATTGAVVNTFTVPNATTNAHNTADYPRDNDNIAWNAVGKTSLGGVDISDDDQVLYVMNLENRRLYALNATTGAVITSISVANLFPTGCATCNQTGDVRPFAVEFYKGKIYIGIIYSAETSNNRSDLRAYIYTADPITLALSATPVFQFALDYSRGKAATTGPGDWRAWKNTYTNISTNLAARVVYPMPMLTSITFDNDNLIIGLRDRLGDIVGNQSKDNPDVADPNYNNLYQARTAGDLLRANGSPTTGWTLESAGRSNGNGTAIQNTGQGVGNAEFYHGDSYPAAATTTTTTPYTVNGVSYNIKTGTSSVTNGNIGDTQGFGVNHDELSLGTSTQLSGFPDVVAVVFDPTLDNGPEGFHDGGIRWLNNSTGGWAQSYRIYNGDGTATVNLGKANGLGELVTLCAAAPIEIGNRVWTDTDKDGLQDANETGIDGLTVDLYKGTTKVGTTTTANGGQYYFTTANVNLNAATGILPNTAYEIRIATAQTPLSNLVLTTTDVASNGSDLIDNDGTASGANAVKAFTTGNAGENNHGYDFGFRTPDCIINLTPSVSSCYDSNGNATGGASVATVQAVVTWANAPSAETINVSCTDATAQSINPATATSPMTLNFEVPANGAAVTLTATFSTTTTCTATQNITTPAGNCLLAPCQSGNVGGTVWRDYNANGVKEAGETEGLGSVTVKAYDCNNNLVETTTTDYQGQYRFTTLTPSATNKYRLEFSNIPPQYKPTFNGSNGRTDVQIVSAATCTAHFGVNNPMDYCQTNPRYVLPCYVNGTSSGTAANDAAIISTPYASTGLNSAYADFNGAQGTGPAARMDALTAQVGSVWGEAYHITQKHFYFGTFLKRHVGMADGPGFIYNFDYSGTTPTYTGKFNVQGATPNNGGAAIDLGTVCRDATCAASGTGIAADYVLPSGKATPNVDLDAFGKVGTMSFGDLEMQPNSDYLWAVNLYQKALIRIDVSGNPTSLPTGIEQYILSALPNYPSTSAGVLRPWALKFNNGKGYLGLVADASAGSQSDLRAYVLQFDPTNMAAGFTQVLGFDPNIKKDSDPLQAPVKFQKWINTYSTPPVTLYPLNGKDYAFYPQPVLSDIEFDGAGNMYLSFFDRLGHQLGYDNYPAVSQTTSFIRTWTFGELLKACNNNGVWNIEGQNACHAGTEFFQDIMGDGNPEASEGALAVLKGSNQLLNVSVDPHPQGMTGTTYFATQGTMTYNLATGAIDNWYSVYYGNNPLFGKANGLGDVEFQCSTAPIEVGNYVWKDTDKDGVQDPCETPLSNVAISLWKNGVQIASTTTDANGEYYFSSKYRLGAAWTGTGADTTLLPNTAYEIRIDTATQAALFNKLALTAANAATNTGNDQNDNDATTSGVYKVIAFTTGAAGSTNHTLDFGFYPFCDTTLTVSNTTICNGSTVNLFAQASGVKGTLTYSTNGTTWTALINPTNVTPSLSTTYFIKDSLATTCLDIDTLTITVNQPVMAGVGTNPASATCQAGSGLSNINLAGQITGATSGGTWAQTVGTAVGTALNTATGVLNPNGLAVGTYVFRYTVKGTAPCPDDTEDITITIQNCCPPTICVPVTVVRN